VALLADGDFPAGAFSRTWDGRDARGRQLASGTYFLRLSAGGEIATQKLLMLQ